MMNCGYDPEPNGHYDLPPIAPQLWQSLVIAGEQLVIGILAAVVHQGRAGRGQAVTCAIHEAVAKSTELDLMNWVMRHAPMYRQTCRHAACTLLRVNIAAAFAPFGATATSVGSLNASGPLPATPGLPSASSTLPSGLNLKT